MLLFVCECVGMMMCVGERINMKIINIIKAPTGKHKVRSKQHQGDNIKKFYCMNIRNESFGDRK